MPLSTKGSLCWARLVFWECFSSALQTLPHPSSLTGDASSCKVSVLMNDPLHMFLHRTSSLAQGGLWSGWESRSRPLNILEERP